MRLYTPLNQIKNVVLPDIYGSGSASILSINSKELAAAIYKPLQTTEYIHILSSSTPVYNDQQAPLGG